MEFPEREKERELLCLEEKASLICTWVLYHMGRSVTNKIIKGNRGQYKMGTCLSNHGFSVFGCSKEKQTVNKTALRHCLVCQDTHSSSGGGNSFNMLSRYFDNFSWSLSDEGYRGNVCLNLYYTVPQHCFHYLSVYWAFCSKISKRFIIRFSLGYPVTYVPLSS